MKKKLKNTDADQLTFFSVIDEAKKAPENAVSMLTGGKYRLHQIEPWMHSLVAAGEFYILCAGHPLVLSAAVERIESEMLYRHYKVHDKIYAATAVGRDASPYDIADDIDCDASAVSNPVLYEIADDAAVLRRTLDKNSDGTITGVEYSFAAMIDKDVISDGLLKSDFKSFWNEKAGSESANVLLYHGLNCKEARMFVGLGKHPYVNDMTSSFASYFTRAALSATYVMDFEKNE